MLSVSYNPTYRTDISKVFKNFLQSYSLGARQLTKCQQFSSISYNILIEQLKLNSFYPLLTTLFIESQKASIFYQSFFLSIFYFSVHKTSTGFTNFLHPYLSNLNFSPVFYNFLQPYLSDHKNPAVVIIFLQLHLSVWKTSLVFVSFLHLYLPLQFLLILYNLIYLVIFLQPYLSDRKIS